MHRSREHPRAGTMTQRIRTTKLPLRAHQPPGRPRGIAVITTPPAERHGLPALMAAACLREDHWLVHHLSVDLPVAEVIGLAMEVGADLIVLSTATAEAARAAARSGSAARSRQRPAGASAGRARRA